MRAASTINRLLTNGRKAGELSAGAITFCKELAIERMGIAQLINCAFTGSKETEHGLAHEAEAISFYEAARFASVYDQQKGVSRPELWLSCTPDGYVEDDMLVEIKCPYSELVHFDYLHTDGQALRDKYNDQVQLQMLLTGRNVCDLVSYHPHFSEPYRLVIATVHASAEWQDRALDRVSKANALIQEIIEQFNVN